MSDQVLFLEIGTAQPSAFYEAFFAVAGSRRCGRITSLEDLGELELGDKTAAAFVIAWSNCQFPSYVVELIKQHPSFSRHPMVIATPPDVPEIEAFCQEYSLDYRIPENAVPALAAAELNTLLEEDTAGETPRALRAFRLRNFYHKLHSGDLSGAESMVESWDASSDKSEPVFLRGLVLKTRKDFEAAFKVLGKVLVSAQDKARMDAKFLHLLGDVSFKRNQSAQARTFLEAAHKRSPRNLRRLFLLGQLYLEMREPTLAIGAYRSIYEAAPSYSGIHVRLAELLYARATAPAQVDVLIKLFPHIAETKLIGLYKKANLNVDALVRSRFLVLLAQELMRHGEVFAARDDFYGALNLVTRAGVMLPPDAGDAIRLEVECRSAELHIAAGDLEKAEEVLTKLTTMKLSGERLEKAKQKLSAAKIKASKTSAA